MGPHHPERKAPFQLFECLKPLSETITAYQNTDGTFSAGFYVSVRIPGDAPAGKLSGSFAVCVGEESFAVPYEITVYDEMCIRDRWYTECFDKCLCQGFQKNYQADQRTGRV